MNINKIKVQAIVLTMVCLISCGANKIQKDTRGTSPAHGNWCGPGHPKYSDMLAPKPIDDLDSVCMRHDYCYTEKGYNNCDCDAAFIDELENIKVKNIDQGIKREAYIKTFEVVPCAGKETILKPIRLSLEIWDKYLENGNASIIAVPIEAGYAIIQIILNSVGLNDSQEKK